MKCKFVKGTVRMTYSKAALNRAYRRYSFGFNVGKVTCRAGYDPQKDRFYIAGPETGAELADLVQKVEAIIQQSALDVDAIDVRSFLCKHFRAMTKIEQDLRRAALSERRFEFTDSKPIDMQQMSLEHQCLLEVLQEQSEKANEDAVANGTPHDVSYTVTTGMVESKMKEKLAQLSPIALFEGAAVTSFDGRC